jgi:hypothetical protein
MVFSLSMWDLGQALIRLGVVRLTMHSIDSTDGIILPCTVSAERVTTWQPSTCDHRPGHCCLQLHSHPMG